MTVSSPLAGPVCNAAGPSSSGKRDVQLLQSIPFRRLWRYVSDKDMLKATNTVNLQRFQIVRIGETFAHMASIRLPQKPFLGLDESVLSKF